MSIYDPGCYKEHKVFASEKLLNCIIREGFCVDFTLESPEDRMKNMDDNTLSDKNFDIKFILLNKK